MFELTMRFTTSEQLYDFVAGMTPPSDAVIDKVMAEVATVETHAKKRGRPSKTEIAAALTPQAEVFPAPIAEAPAPAPAIAPTPTSLMAGPTPTIDTVREALTAYIDANGFQAGSDMLQSFNAKRLSDLPEAMYATFVSKVAV